MSKPKTPQNASITKRVPNAPERPRYCRGDVEKEVDSKEAEIPKVKRRLVFELVEEDPILRHIHRS
jgi:hypothetical protein